MGLALTCRTDTRTRTPNNAGLEAAALPIELHPLEYLTLRVGVGQVIIDFGLRSDRHFQVFAQFEQL